MVSRIAEFLRACLRPASGGAISPPRRDPDSVPVWLSNGLVSEDGGRTWREVEPPNR